MESLRQNYRLPKPTPAPSLSIKIFIAYKGGWFWLFTHFSALESMRWNPPAPNTVCTEWYRNSILPAYYSIKRWVIFAFYTFHCDRMCWGKTIAISIQGTNSVCIMISYLNPAEFSHVKIMRIMTSFMQAEFNQT